MTTRMTTTTSSDSSERPWMRVGDEHAAMPREASRALSGARGEWRIRTRDRGHEITKEELRYVARLASIDLEAVDRGVERALRDVNAMVGFVEGIRETRAANEGEGEAKAKAMWTTRGEGEGLKMRIDACARANARAGEGELAALPRTRVVGEAKYATDGEFFVAPRSGTREE